MKYAARPLSILISCAVADEANREVRARDQDGHFAVLATPAFLQLDLSASLLSSSHHHNTPPRPCHDILSLLEARSAVKRASNVRSLPLRELVTTFIADSLTESGFRNGLVYLPRRSSWLQSPCPIRLTPEWMRRSLRKRTSSITIEEEERGYMMC